MNSSGEPCGTKYVGPVVLPQQRLSPLAAFAFNPDAALFLVLIDMIIVQV